MLDYLRALWANNPVLLSSVLASAVVAGAAYFDVVLDEASVVEIIGVVVPIVLSGVVARSKVTPYQGEIGPASDDVLDPSGLV